MNRLADTVVGLSDEAILAETTEAGADPQAERTRSVFRQALKALEREQTLVRLSHLAWPHDQFK
jgi:hypothetical protein